MVICERHLELYWTVSSAVGLTVSVVRRWVTLYHFARIPPLMEALYSSFQDMRSYDKVKLAGSHMGKSRQFKCQGRQVRKGVQVYLERGVEDLCFITGALCYHIMTCTARPACFGFTFLPFSSSN
jgi:hypothetical protein